MSIIHIAPNLDYLFPATREKARVLCGRRAADVLTDGEFIGISGNLNRVVCTVCPECDKKWREE